MSDKGPESSQIVMKAVCCGGQQKQVERVQEKLQVGGKNVLNFDVLNHG